MYVNNLRETHERDMFTRTLWIGDDFKMAEFRDMEPPFSLHSMERANSETDSMDLVGEEDDEEHEDQGVFVLRQKRNVIYSLDYKYRVGK